MVAYSSGNHAQGVAHAAALCGVGRDRDAARRAAAERRGAGIGGKVVLYDREREDRAGIARALCEKRGATLVPPFDDPMIIAGQGTAAGREIAEDLEAASSRTSR